MTDARDSAEEPGDESRTARLLMVAVLALAVIATAVLVLTDSARWLRLGVLAALWAALLGVFLATRFRKAMHEREAEVADVRSTYELELEREVAARREYELEVEAAARKRVAEANREDLAELRAELRVLRESLERLTGGEVLVERFALQAQSTRMRSLSDGQRRVVPAADASGRMRRGITAGQQHVDPAATEMISRSDQPAPVTPIRREPQRHPAGRPREGTDQTPVAERSTRVTRPVQPPPQQPSRRQAADTQTQTQAWPAPAADRQPPRRPAQQPQRRPVRQTVRREPTPGDEGLSARLDPDEQAAKDPTPVQRQPIRPEPIRAQPTGGRRRAPEPPQEPALERSRHSAEPTPDQDVPHDYQSYREWRQSAEPEAETSGAHTAGRSVTELLAAHANAEDPPSRHRRRAD